MIYLHVVAHRMSLSLINLLLCVCWTMAVFVWWPRSVPAMHMCTSCTITPPRICCTVWVIKIGNRSFSAAWPLQDNQGQAWCHTTWPCMAPGGLYFISCERFLWRMLRSYSGAVDCCQGYFMRLTIVPQIFKKWFIWFEKYTVVWNQTKTLLIR